LEVCPEYDQKALEVRTPLVQNGPDEHGPDRGDIAVEWVHVGRLCRARHNAEDFKQGAMFEKAADAHVVDGTLLKIPLC
jgi:hypothetical protein